MESSVAFSVSLLAGWLIGTINHKCSRSFRLFTAGALEYVEVVVVT